MLDYIGVISIHPPRAGWDLFHLLHFRLSSISIHPPRAGWDSVYVSLMCLLTNFNPPTPCGVGRGRKDGQCRWWDFNPPTPCGVGPDTRAPRRRYLRFQSTHPVRGGTWQILRHCPCIVISIHPPRAGWDTDFCNVWMLDIISIHPPRAGWDGRSVVCNRRIEHFNPPTPCGVGPSFYRSSVYLHNFNPPTPCGVGLARGRYPRCTATFQSTHPVRGGTLAHLAIIREAFIFQSTHPVRGGTWFPGRFPSRRHISIHPPRAGWDLMILDDLGVERNFNPPTPCGVGPGSRFFEVEQSDFNPPTPCGVGHG